MRRKNPQELDSFFSEFKKISYKKGETILRPTEKPSGVFFLKKGYAKLYSLSKDAQELTFIIYRPGDFFPTIWPIQGPPLRYYTEALTNVEVHLAPKEQFQKFIKANNEVLFEITNRILTRFAGLLLRMEYAIFGNAGSKYLIEQCLEGEEFSAFALVNAEKIISLEEKAKK